MPQKRPTGRVRTNRREAAEPTKRDARPKRRRAGSVNQTSLNVNAVVLRVPGTAADITLAWPTKRGPRLSEVQRLAMEWSHIVRNRDRWTRTQQSADQQASDAARLLRTLGVTEQERKTLADASHVEVAIPFTAESAGWEARILPWEFVISAGTRDLRNGPLTITRQLERGGPAPAKGKKRVLYVQSAPDPLSNIYDFSDEAKLVKASTGAQDFKPLTNPTLDALADALKQFKPTIVHLAGFDTHQGLALAKDDRASTEQDGYLLKGAGSDFDPVGAQRLADTFKASGVRPELVVCNIWNSAARVAPLLVAAGAGAAIGFQDSFDDALAELFLSSLYRAHTASDGDLGAAFTAAWKPLTEQPKSIKGTGIALWSATSLIRTPKAMAASTIAEQLSVESQRSINSEDFKDTDLESIFAISVKPVDQVSYSLLHNNRDLFSQFLIRKLRPERVDGLNVRVELNVGVGTYPYRESFSLAAGPRDMTRLVRIALTSDLARSVDELLRTSLFVRVEWGKHVLFSRTFPVTLAPVDQWDDNKRDPFLPSFVFPRDPVVAQIVDAAQEYVVALRDDPTAGFDGYQAIDPDLENPVEDVDNQVQALWYALIYKTPLAYINPPPTYAVAAQRLRTPSDVVEGKRGTCIDLALLVAACLEYVEIYPVIFLLVDHAFPGYWRTEEARDAFLQRVNRLPEDAQQTNGQAVATSGQERQAWYFDKTFLGEIRKEVAANNLVPLESVNLTSRSSFDESISDSTEYFKVAKDFDSMLDIQMARDCNITPLPLRRLSAGHDASALGVG